MFLDFLTYDVPLAALILLVVCIFITKRLEPRKIYKCISAGTSLMNRGFPRKSSKVKRAVIGVVSDALSG